MISVVLLGPPGVGKGTQAEVLRREFGFTVVSSGVLLRQHVTQATSVGARVAHHMARGELVPEALVAGVVSDEVARCGTRPVVVEGYPKTAAQARALDAVLRDVGRRADAVLAFSAGLTVLRQRLVSRAGSGGRTDDAPATVAARLTAFGVVPDGLLAHYRDQGVLHPIDAERSIAAVSADVRRVVAAFAPSSARGGRTGV